MISVSILSRENAGERAKLWLEGLSPLTRETKALRSLGLLCCKRLRSGDGLSGKGGSALLRLPSIAIFVTMGRERTHALCRSISLASIRARRMKAKKQGFWSEIFGSVALSYARMGDPATTAALLRASARLGLKHVWLLEAKRFLLDQQTPEGCFGLFARELALIESDHTPWMAHLSLSVEILWALAEVKALHADQSQAMNIPPTRPLAITSGTIRRRSSETPNGMN
jgi:hypothetical protein